MLPLKIANAINGVPSSGSQSVRPSAEFTQTVVLAATTVKQVTIPDFGAKKLAAFFNWTYGDDLFFSPSTAVTIVVPTSTVTTSTNELLTPGCGRIVVAGQVIQLFSPQTPYVTIAYYALVQD